MSLRGPAPAPARPVPAAAVYTTKTVHEIEGGPQEGSSTLLLIEDRAVPMRSEKLAVVAYLGCTL